MDSGANNYRQYLAGDENAFVSLVRDYKDGLILYIYSFVANISIAEELTEDTFVRIGVKKPYFYEKSSFKTWLYAIARNIAYDYLRGQAKIKEISIDICENLADEELLENTYIKSEEKIQLHKSMCKLKQEYQQVLWLIYFEDFSYKEVAKIIKKSAHNVETIAYRARQALKSELEKEGFNYENL